MKTLVNMVSMGGNLMVGIGPDENGRFHPKAIEQLEYAGRWLKENGDAIYATRPREGELYKQGEDIRFTRSKDAKTVYAICFSLPSKQLVLKTVTPR